MSKSLSSSFELEYGNVIKIISDSNSTYEGKYFFVERLQDDKIVLLSDKETISLGITDQELDDKTIEKIVIVYKPKKGQGFIFQNKLFAGQMIEIEFESNSINGKIINIDKETIEVEIKDTHEILYIPLHRGLPKEIIGIKTIHKKVETAEKAEMDDFEIDDGLLNVIEEDIEEDELYYSIEQQKNDFLENLLMYIPIEQRNPKKMKYLNKMIQRYVELRKKYTTFSDGIYVNHLQYEQIFSTTVALQNKLYVPITKNIHIKLSDPKDAEDPKDNFFKETTDGDEWIKKFSDLKENLPFNQKMAMIHDFDNFIYFSTPTSKQMKYTPITTATLAYIIAKTEYPIMVSEPFVVDSLMGHPKFYIDYSKVTLPRSFIIEKAQLSLTPYYGSLYSIDNGSFCNEHRVAYKNEQDTFDKYIKKIIPSMDEFIKCANKPFVNMIDALNGVNVLEINELNSSNYLLINEIIKKNIHKIKQNFIKTRPSYLTKPNKDRIVEKQTVMDIFTEYENLSKVMELKRYFSTSEIFKMAEIDLYKLLAFQYSIRNSSLNQSSDAEIQSIIDQIREEKDKPLEKQVNKVYESIEEMQRDNHKPIIIRDVETEPGSGIYMSSIELLHRELMQNEKTKTKMTKSLDHFKDQVDGLIATGMKYNHKSGILYAEFTAIKEFVIKNKIVKGDVALVDDKKYVWSDEKWVDYKEPSVTKKLVTVKGEIDTSEKEEMYNKKILELVKNIEKDKLKVRDLKEFYNEENKKDLKLMLVSLVKKNVSNGLKYNNEKLLLEQHEIGDKTGIVESPHEKVRDKILKVYELDIKYKALQLFIERYCKRGSNEFWYYCIDTGVKLLPTFFNKLASAYLITNNYEDVLEQVCLTQGALSDSGDKWVDKNSGYIIKNIEFDYDEGYTETGFKNISRGIIDKPDNPVRDDDQTMNSIKVLIKFAGLADIGDNVEWIYSHVTQSHQKAKKSMLSGSPSSLEVIAIISVVLVYVQTLEKLHFIKAFPNCKASFSGYPLSDGYAGIKYLCCIVSKMEKPNLPFSSVRSMQVEEMEKKVIEFIKRFVLNVEIDNKLREKRLYHKEEDVAQYTPWKLFLPRLKAFRPVVFQNIGQSEEDQIYYLSFLIQHKINTFISKQPPILINHNQTPYLVNTCCNQDNDTSHYFAKKDPTIVDTLKEIRRLSISNNKIKQLLKHPIFYSYMNTKKVSIPISTELDETTLFTGLIKLFNFDNSLPIPITLSRFDIVKPEHYNKNDDIQLKIRKLKEHGYDIKEKMLYEMLQTSATIIKEQIKEVRVEDPIDDPIMEFLDTPNLKNKAFEMLEKKLKECDKHKKTKDYDYVLRMDFKSEKRSSTIPVEMEHYTYLYQVLYNKIQSFINFAEMVTSRKSHDQMVTCKHWNLSHYHYDDINKFVDSYYSTIQGFFTDKELAAFLIKQPLDKYKRMLNLPIKNPETKYLVYHYIFISIYELYLSSKSKSIRQYLDAVTSLFKKENIRAMDFDLKTIKYEIKLSKKSEAEIKKTYFSKLGSDELVSENTMKNLKLGKWGIGLQKSMFEYDKDTYLKDKLAADDVVQLMGNAETNELEQVEQVDHVEDEYGAFIPEDDDYQEGFDGDELY